MKEMETEIMDNATYKFKLEELATVYQETRKRYIAIAKEMIDDKLVITDFYFSAAIDQGIRLLDGMLPMLEQRNPTCAAALLRMQIDTCLRTYAAFIADDIDAFMEGYIEGRKIDEFRDDRGKAMKDWYLRKRLSEHFQSIDEDYNLASGFVHFSHNAFQMISRTHDDYRVSFFVGCDVPEDMNQFLFETGQASVQYCIFHQELLMQVAEAKKKPVE